MSRTIRFRVRFPLVGPAALLLLAVGLAVTPAPAQEPGVRREGELVYFNLQNVDVRTAL